MAIFSQDQSQVSWQYETGTYATPTGTSQWPGHVQSHNPSEDTGVNKKVIRYIGAGDRSPSPYTHTISEANSDNSNGEIAQQVLPSFSVEDAQRVLIAGSGLNLIRTYKGCIVDSFSMNMAEGEPISVEVGYTAKTVDFSSGTIATVTAATTSPFLWEHTLINLAGTKLNTVKSSTFSIKNNLDAPHYVDNTINISTPIPKARDYEMTLNLNADSSRTNEIYNQYFIGGSTFNVDIFSAVGSATNDILIAMSGCKLTGFSDTSATEGVVEHVLTIIPKNVSVIVDDAIQFYNAGSYAGTV